MAFHKTAIFLWFLGCLLTSCVNHVSLPISTPTAEPEATASPPASHSPTQETPSLQTANLITVSPNGLYLIACQFPDLVLFDVKSGTALSQLNLGYSACQRNIHWSPDSLSAILIDQEGTIYQWRVDGSQPIEVETNIDIPASRHTVHAEIMTA